jgi:hypothetical protein
MPDSAPFAAVAAWRLRPWPRLLVEPTSAVPVADSFHLGVNSTHKPPVPGTGIRTALACPIEYGIRPDIGVRIPT